MNTIYRRFGDIEASGLLVIQEKCRAMRTILVRMTETPDHRGLLMVVWSDLCYAHAEWNSYRVMKQEVLNRSELDGVLVQLNEIPGRRGFYARKWRR